MANIRYLGEQQSETCILIIYYWYCIAEFLNAMSNEQVGNIFDLTAVSLSLSP
jgi:hypothetical protein